MSTEGGRGDATAEMVCAPRHACLALCGVLDVLKNWTLVPRVRGDVLKLHGVEGCESRDDLFLGSAVCFSATKHREKHIWKQLTNALF